MSSREDDAQTFQRESIRLRMLDLADVIEEAATMIGGEFGEFTIRQPKRRALVAQLRERARALQ